MNLNFHIANLSLKGEGRKPARTSGFGLGTLDCRPAQRGIALVITLIMLSVITFMTVTFLVLSQRERGQVTTTTDQLTAKQTAESALERAKIELLAPMLAQKNDQLYNLIVSTNFINPRGFDPAAVDYRINVNYDYTAANGALTPNQRLQNLANLLYNPRPPVFTTNRLRGTSEFRYYLDLNRNGFYDTNGFIPEIGVNGLPVVNGGVTNYGFYIGDPEWIGVLERPEMPHSGNNKFIARYAYIAIPAGKTLDVNYIHNQAVTRSLNGNDGYLRNQGVGAWEINLAAFWADLNPNYWGPTNVSYEYRQAYPAPLANTGTAFDDAQSFLRNRYNGFYNFQSLQSAEQIFARTAIPFIADGVDQYSDGPLMFGTSINENLFVDDVKLPWAGADNPSHLFTTQEFYNPNRTSIAFTNRLGRTGTNVNSFDRYTYYRMLDQLGTDSTPERGKYNINHRNVDDLGNFVPGMETNLIAWTPDRFFTNVANHLVRSHTAAWMNTNFFNFTNTFGVNNSFGITNLPVFVTYDYLSNGVPIRTNVYGYTPGVHRLLQLTANIYDSTTNRVDTVYPHVPHVFRPIFRQDGSPDANVFIVGYREVVAADVILPILQSASQIDLASRTGAANSRDRLPLIGQPFLGDANEPMVSGIPLVIGAKKGFPNFNKFALQNSVTVSRNLKFHRDVQGGPLLTNQSYSIGISNSFGAQAWNSYSNSFSRPLQMIAVTDVSVSVTNEVGTIAAPSGGVLSNRFYNVANMTISPWPGFVTSQATNSFIVPVLTNTQFLPTAEYVQQTDVGGYFDGTDTVVYDPDNRFRVPHLWLSTRSRVRFTVVDPSVNRIVDYVNLDSTEAPINLFDTAGRGGRALGIPQSDLDPGALWITNRWGDPSGNLKLSNTSIATYGIVNQIRISAGAPIVSDSYWQRYNRQGNPNDKADAISKFAARLFFDKTGGITNFAAPFNPMRTFYQNIRWEANDPLVHYMVQDLTDLLAGTDDSLAWDTNTKGPIRRLIAENPLSDHYRPWNGNPNNPAETSVPTLVNPQVKDPLMTRSDDWDFPTNKLANVGWLGRVHRGTPWQTVYMKSSDISNDTWYKWTGNIGGNGVDAFMDRPAMDRQFFDFFTTAPNENATRGQLSINQTNLAAWSAVLSGVPVLTNASGTIGSGIIQPASLSPEVGRIVQGINYTRTLTNQNGTLVYPNLQFPRLGDILAVPEFTEASPFLNTNGLKSRYAAGINDAVLERIPQQIMSLLNVSHSPRFVVYSYGQTLRPAESSIVTANGPFFQMCTNYQVAAETATRAVVRIEGSFDPTESTNANPLLRYPPRVVIEQFNVLPPD
jgi:hypothetical protein